MNKEPVPPEVYLHNLEHGGIYIGHRCSDCPDLVDTLDELTEHYDMLVIAPNPDLDSPLALSAWGRTLELDGLNPAAQAAIVRFINAYHGIDHHTMGSHGQAPPEAD